MKHLIGETINNCLDQKYCLHEIVIYDDCSTDGTDDVAFNLFNDSLVPIEYFRGEKNVGVGGAFNAGIEKATGDIVVLMCADDLFCNDKVISDIVKCFEVDPQIFHVSRYYHQFIDGDRRPVRAWRSSNPFVLANNPSGLAFRKSQMYDAKCASQMFVETTALLNECCAKNPNGRIAILKYDAIAARVHKSTSTQAGYWLKHRVSSPVMDQVSLGATEIATDYASLIQIKNGFTMSAVLEEIWNFVKIRPLNLLNPIFWFYTILVIITPRMFLRNIPNLYRRTWGRWTTREIKRCA
jgi:glycosyltransferase involved in cell wall biosynthesis